jgi:isoquinoline 1-oxidoreductase beta subunit
MIHHRPQGFDHHFFRHSHLVIDAAAGGSMVVILGFPLGDGGARNASLRIDGDGKVFLTMPHLRMGPGICTSIRMLIAEELEVALDQVRLEHAPPQQGFAADQVLAAQAVDPSKAVRRALKLLGEAAATARVMLIATAAERWGADARACHAHEGEVIHGPTWRKLRYGQLAIDAAHMPIPRQVQLKAPRAESRPG